MPLDKNDLARMAKLIAEKIDSVNWDESESTAEIFIDLAPKVEVATQMVVPQLFSGFQASESIVAFLYSVDVQIEALVSPSQIKSSLSLPTAFRRDVNTAQLRLKTVTDSIQGVEEKIRSINSAYDAAERLPTTQEDLAQAMREIEASKLESTKLDATTRLTADNVEQLKSKLVAANVEAEAVLSKVQAAYRAATSQGLAQAFSEKATSLNSSMQKWVLVLLIALVVTGLLAHSRFPAILQAVAGKPDWGVIFLNLILGVLSVAPPIWVAWVATKQIGQRFRLAEDYGYKAALSAAYEGYRNEAAKLDPLFEAQLFATALGRLDELPIRLVEPEIHGSPWHELLTSEEFKSAAASFPNLKDRVIAILRPSSKTQEKMSNA